jgi:hypothetical protein
MKIDNLCKSVPVQCGACKTEESLMRYLAIEGWIKGYYICEKCGYRRGVMASPALLKKKGKITRLEQTSCQKCEHDFLIFKQR